MKKEIDGSIPMQTQIAARKELQEKSVQREKLNNTYISEEKESRIATMRTLEVV
jgi:hypothetical protein